MSATKPQQKQQSQDRLADYITVAERIEKFYERWPDGRIITQIIEHDPERGFILMRAEAYRNADDALPSGTGHAFELKSEGYVQRTSYIEVCETSCVGRALANLGLEVRRGSQPSPPAALRSPAAPDQRCEQTANKPQGTIIQNQLDWLDGKFGATLVQECKKRFDGREPEMLSLQEAGDWIKEIGKAGK